MIRIVQGIKLVNASLRNLPLVGRVYKLRGLFITAAITTVAAVRIAKKNMDEDCNTVGKEGSGANGACAAIKTTGSQFSNNRFHNPFKTWRDPGLMTLLKWKVWHRDDTNLPETEQELNDTLPVIKPTFQDKLDNPSDMVVTWLGHATTLVQIDGVNILTDPVFSAQCGPLQNAWVSHKRFRPAPCAVNDLPQIHAVVISHSHYDHLDYQSVKDLNWRFSDRLHWFVPLKLKSWFESIDCPNVHEMDWWDEKTLPSHPDIKLAFTPAQHWSSRTLVDQYQTLWGSWCVIGPKHRFYFAGDTGYCEAFKQIGQKYGPFDLAAIPIGAYLPRDIMAPQHVDPSQAVEIHRDIKAMKSVAIHWGTFALANEFYLQPPRDLANALETKKVPKEDFFVLQHGESKTIDGNPTATDDLMPTNKL